MSNEGGRKDDTGKSRFDLLPVNAISWSNTTANVVDSFDVMSANAMAWWSGKGKLGTKHHLAFVHQYAMQAMGPRAMQHLAEVYTMGAKKYEDRNWEKGLAWSRVYAAMMRHMHAWKLGEECDQVDGQKHLASVAWCALALITYHDTHPELDDRP